MTASQVTSGTGCKSGCSSLHINTWVPMMKQQPQCAALGHSSKVPTNCHAPIHAARSHQQATASAAHAAQPHVSQASVQELAVGTTSHSSAAMHPSQQQQQQQHNHNQAGSNGNGSGSTTTQQQLANELLERAAAAPRPAGPPPEQQDTSSSSSSSRSSSRGSGVSHARQGGTTPWRSAPPLQLAADAVITAAAAAAATAVSEESGGHGGGAFAAAGVVASEAMLEPHQAPTAASASGGTSEAVRSSSSSDNNAAPPSTFPVQQAADGVVSNHRLSRPDWLLMQEITRNCHSWEDVAAVYNEAARRFTAQHYAAALHRLACLWQQEQQVAPQQAQQFLHASRLQQQLSQMQQLAGSLMQGFVPQLHAAQLRDVADAWYAVDALDLLQRSNPAAADGSSPAAAAAGGGSSSGGPSSSVVLSAGVSPSVGTFVSASLQHTSRLLQRQPLAELRQLSRILTSLAHLGVNPGGDWWAGALDASAGIMEQLPAAAAALGPGSSSSSSRDGSDALQASAQAVALTGWVVARLNAPASTAWWRLFHEASAGLMPAMSASQLSTCLYASARMGHMPSADWMGAFYAASSRCLHQVTPQGFANILWALAVLQQQPPAQWCADFDAASAAQLPHFTQKHLGMYLWACAQLQAAQPHVAAATESVTRAQHQQHQQQHQQQQQEQQDRQQQRLQEQEQQQFPSTAWQEQAWVQLSRLEPNAQASQGLACVLWAVMRLGLQLPQPRLLELEAMCLETVPHMQAQALAVTVWALGGLRGAAADRRLVKRVRWRCSHEPKLLQGLAAPGLCMLLCGLAGLHAWHPDSFKQLLVDTVAARVAPPQRQQSPKQRRKQQQQQQQQQQQHLAAQQLDSSSNRRTELALQPASLPVVLLYLRQLRTPVSQEVLQRCEARLQEQLHMLPVSQVCLALFALAAARHSPSEAFLLAALGRVSRELPACGSLDVSHVLFCLASLCNWGGNVKQVLQQPEQQELQHRLVERAGQLLQQVDSRSLAMLLWSLGRLQLQPPQPFLQAAMAATLHLMPGMSLLSIVSILAAFRTLQYLPPLPWMLEVCAAARAKVSTDDSARGWQQRACVRRFEETLEWYNQAVQQAAAGGAAAGSVLTDEALLQHGQRQQQRARAMGMLAAGAAGSEAMLAAAVGVAAAVAQQWHP